MKPESTLNQRSRLTGKKSVPARRLVLAGSAVVIGLVTVTSTLGVSAVKPSQVQGILKPAGAPVPVNHDDFFESSPVKSEVKEPKYLGFARSKIIAIAEDKDEKKKQPREQKVLSKSVKKTLTLAQVTNESTSTDSDRGVQSMDAATSVPKASYAEPQENKKRTSLPDSVTGGVRVEDIVEQTEVYRFSGLEKPDPFLAPVTVLEPLKPQSLDAEEIPIISPLQYYDLKSLLVTGVWETERGQWKAMIETPDHQGIIAKLQDAVGNSGGRITEISRYGVLVREYKLRKDGTQEFSDRIMPMAKESDGGEAFKGGTIVLTPGAAQPEVIRPQSEVAQPQVTETIARDTVKDAVKETLKETVKDSPKDSPVSNIVPAQVPASAPIDSMNPVVNGGRL